MLASGFATVAADGQVDLTLDMSAPMHVAAGSQYIVNVSYANIGTEAAPDSWVTAIIPTGTAFITATDRWGAPLPPELGVSGVLTWYLTALPPDSQRGHIFISLAVDEGLPEGHILTTTASIATTAVESDTTNNAASVASTVCDMAGSTKQVHARQVMPGDALTYTIGISLAQRFGGGMNGRWVTLTDTLPFSHQVRFLGWRGTMTGTQIDGHTLRWQGRVRAGEPLSLQYRLGVEGTITPGMIITNVAWLGWGEGQMRLGPVTTVVTLPRHGLVVGPWQGGQLRAHGVTLTIPPGAVTDTTRFQLGPLFTDTRPSPSPPGLIFAHRAFALNAFRFGQDVNQFGQPLTITIGFSETDLAGLQRETVRLWTRHGPLVPWARLGEPVRTMSGTLVFTTTHFSQFALFGAGKYLHYLPLVTQ
jgi:hypothetical protein